MQICNSITRDKENKVAIIVFAYSYTLINVIWVWLQHLFICWTVNYHTMLFTAVNVSANKVTEN